MRWWRRRWAASRMARPRADGGAKSLRSADLLYWVYCIGLRAGILRLLIARGPAVQSRGCTPPRSESAMSWTLSQRAQKLTSSAIREILKVTERPEVISFAGGLPSPDTFPVERLRAKATEVLTNDPSPALQYGPTEGYLKLREWIATRYSTPSARIDPQNVLVTTGSQQALDLLGKTLIDSGSRVLVETPTYLGALQAFSLFEPQFVSVTSDEEGLVPAALTPKLTRGRALPVRAAELPESHRPAHAARAPPGAGEDREAGGPAPAGRRSVRRAVVFRRCVADAAVDAARPGRAHGIVLEGARAGTARRLPDRAAGRASQAGAGEAGRGSAYAELHAAHRLRGREGRLPRHAHPDDPRALRRALQSDARRAEGALSCGRDLERAARRHVHLGAAAAGRRQLQAARPGDRAERRVRAGRRRSSRTSRSSTRCACRS